MNDDGSCVVCGRAFVGETASRYDSMLGGRRHVDGSPACDRSPDTDLRTRVERLERNLEAVVLAQSAAAAQRRRAMVEIPLYTNDGELVAHVLVPPWEHPPELYVWGTRFFVRREDGRYTGVDGSYFVLPREHIEAVGMPYQAVTGEDVVPDGGGE